jgi:hypothetical protein
LDIAIEYGICRLSLAPVRRDPNDQSEQVSQLLFGEQYEVLSYNKDNRWIRIRNFFDLYEGWIDARQHHLITREHFEYLNRADFKITTDVTSSILYNKSPVDILMGSIIPISGSELFKMEEQFAFNGESKSLGQKRDAEFVGYIANKYLNAPYVWGGKTPFGIDCSGFTQMVFKIAGYKLMRDSVHQASQGRNVNKFSDCRPGDLAFFGAVEKKISHVGILLPDDKIIHASGRVRIDHFNDEGILNLDAKIYTHSLISIRRILAE